MEYQERDQWEADLQAAIVALWRGVRWPVMPDQMGRDLEAAVREKFEEIQRRVIIFMLLWLMAQEDTPATRSLLAQVEQDQRVAREQSQAQARRLAIEFADAIVRSYDAAPDDPQERDRWLREVLLSDSRAERIAITEVTSAISFAELGAVSLMSEIGIEAFALWMIVHDEKTCPICKPLDGQGEDVWGLDFPAGPPGHPRCRCILQWSLRRTAAP